MRGFKIKHSLKGYQPTKAAPKNKYMGLTLGTGVLINQNQVASDKFVIVK
jgi:hypothetical protein